MSDELDALAESARNRGLKLVRSRVRTPGKRRFGKVGVTDKNGRPLFGMDDKGPIGKPEDAADYLRNLGARDWGASLDVAVMPRKKKPVRALREPANDAEPAPKAGPKPAPRPVKPPPKVKPPPEPKPPEVRTAKRSDAARIAELINLLQHEIDAKALAKNLNQLKKVGELPLVATLDKEVVGLCGVHAMTAIHRPAPVGRIHHPGRRRKSPKARHRPDARRSGGAMVPQIRAASSSKSPATTAWPQPTPSTGTWATTGPASASPKKL